MLMKFLKPSSHQDPSMRTSMCGTSLVRQIPFSHKGGVTGVTWLSADNVASVGNDHPFVTWNISLARL
jgi:hypothetical protein